MLPTGLLKNQNVEESITIELIVYLTEINFVNSKITRFVENGHPQEPLRTQRFRKEPPLSIAPFPRKVRLEQVSRQ